MTRSGIRPLVMCDSGFRLRRRVLALIVLAGTVVLGTAPMAQRAAPSPFDIAGNWVAAGGGATFGGGGGFQEDHDERQDGPALVDYTGIPLNEAGRARALSYNSSLLTVPEHQCMPHPATYSLWGPGAPQISAEVDSNLAIVAYRVGGTFRRADRTIWMDGRAHPPDYAPHTWAGFTTGRWEGTTLVTDTTHLKWGWIRRNGVITSDLTTVRTLYHRHGNVLTITVIVTDPLYLSEPHVRTIDFVPAAQLVTARAGVRADDIGRGPFTPCYPTEEVVLAPHDVPHYFPWANPFVKEEEERKHLPAGATLGGAETALPEFVRQRSEVRGARSTTAGVPAPAIVRQPPATGIHSIKVQGNVWMLTGAGANIAVQVGDDGVLLVDTGARGTSDAVLAAIRRITTAPIRFIVNTSSDPEHAGNNAAFGELAGGATSGKGNGPTPQIVAHSNAQFRLSRAAPAVPTSPLAGHPTDAYLGRQRDFFFNGEAIQIIHAPSAYGDGDSFVHFRGSDVIVAGDLYTTTGFAKFEPAAGGSYRGVLDALNAMLDVAVPRFMQEGGTYIIPGHGRVSDEADLAEVRDQVHMIRDRFAELVIKRNMTLPQVMAMKPLVDFDRRYEQPEWTSEQFAAAVYAETVKQRGR